MATQPVAVVLPLHQETLDRQGTIALASLRHHLPTTPRYLVAPDTLRPTFDVADFRRIDLDPSWFVSRDSYNRLMLTPDFYRLFADFEHVLIYQLDCVLFRSDLMSWCERGYSYLGAPWLSRRRISRKLYPKAVGNGGLSLRRVQDCLTVLAQRDCAVWPRSQAAWRHFLRYKHARRLLRFASNLRSSTGMEGGVAACFHWAEDMFWGYYAPQLWAEFRLPKPLEAVDFAIEHGASEMVAFNGGRLPFGAHAWALHDPEFWQEHFPESVSTAVWSTLDAKSD
ncbi:MAG: hypothetical protein HQ481_14340 [Alphaproteobacteria bacterium]|nr:hypothetical protein [Alphaproteobacteria bacterium]